MDSAAAGKNFQFLLVWNCIPCWSTGQHNQRRNGIEKRIERMKNVKTNSTRSSLRHSFHPSALQVAYSPLKESDFFPVVNIGVALVLPLQIFGRISTSCPA
uniref:Uncharacterized protein n=1 Tax=Cacopsylla melanoneura TaxID=428564 RepID=A0A8D9EA19_9HEMI